MTYDNHLDIPSNPRGSENQVNQLQLYLILKINYKQHFTFYYPYDSLSKG